MKTITIYGYAPNGLGTIDIIKDVRRFDPTLGRRVSEKTIAKGAAFPDTDEGALLAARECGRRNGCRDRR